MPLVAIRDDNTFQKNETGSPFPHVVKLCAPSTTSQSINWPTVIVMKARTNPNDANVI